jgi:AraC-like DNA-binding protein
MLAAELGYADQSHLVREFGELTGASPTAFLAGRPAVRAR